MSEEKTILSKIVGRLRQGGRVLISSHVSPDGDSIGSQLSMYDLCKLCNCEPMIVNHDSAVPRYLFLAKHGLVNVYGSGKTYPRFDCAVLLEAPEISRIGDVQKLLDPDCLVINIDHHADNTRYGQINYVDAKAEAVGMMVYALFHEAGLPITRDNADELFTAILTDTGRFRFSNTTSSAMRLAADLLDVGANPTKISDALYACYREQQLRMIGDLIASMEIHHNGRTCLLLSDRRLREKYNGDADEVEGLADYSLYTCGIKVGALLRELEPDHTKISLRSHGEVDVSAIARVHGGGGHRNAAGCHLNHPFEQAKSILIEQIEKAMPA
jgi:bifunctional oligoribonuclease and PAP phosphatase NrnA